jgi:hypothetical protein
MLSVDAVRVLRFRAQAGALTTRLADDDLRRAAWSGLQDSAPRSALLSLHARAAGVGPGSWADEQLAQVWGPRFAVYLVPRHDFAAFTLGRLPRDPDEVAALNRMATAVVATIGEGPQRINDLFAEVGDRPGHRVRAAGITGRFALRWDASTTAIVPGPPLTLEPEDARRELARRYLRWLGPGTADSFARWAGVTEPDARETWRALADELLPVDFAGTPREILAVDADALHDAAPVTGVRLLPPNDPYLWPDRRLLVEDAARYDALYKPQKEAAGAILVDGAVVGTWARQQARVTLRPWAPLPADVDEAVHAAAHEFAGPMGKRIQVRTEARCG